MICFRCNNLVKLDIIANEKVAGYNIETLNCLTCSSWISLRVDGVLRTLEEILENDKRSNGWYNATESSEFLAHYGLSQIQYRICDKPRKEWNECEFDLPDESDMVRLLWHNKKAVGFYTLKLKGTYVESTDEHYDMVTLDTAYISSKCRRKGFGLSLLEDISIQFPGEDIGFSSPIASPMLKVLEKFIHLYPVMKYKLWEITGTGCEGSRKLVCAIISRNRRKLQSRGDVIKLLTPVGKFNGIKSC